MGPVGFPKKPVRNCLISLRNNPEERSSHLLGSGGLKSCTVFAFQIHKVSDSVYFCITQQITQPPFVIVGAVATERNVEYVCHFILTEFKGFWLFLCTSRRKFNGLCSNTYKHTNILFTTKEDNL